MDLTDRTAVVVGASRGLGSHATGLGRAAVEAYAQRAGHTVDEQMAGMGDVVTPRGAGRAVVELATSPEPPLASLLTADGLRPLP